MKTEEAIATLKGMADGRKACLVMLDAAIKEAETRLLTSSATSPDDIVRARQELMGAITVKNVVSRLLGAIK
jgi:hypothetical protein